MISARRRRSSAVSIRSTDAAERHGPAVGQRDADGRPRLGVVGAAKRLLEADRHQPLGVAPRLVLLQQLVQVDEDRRPCVLPGQRVAGPPARLQLGEGGSAAIASSRSWSAGAMRSPARSRFSSARARKKRSRIRCTTAATVERARRSTRLPGGGSPAPAARPGAGTGSGRSPSARWRSPRPCRRVEGARHQREVPASSARLPSYGVNARERRARASP